MISEEALESALTLLKIKASNIVIFKYPLLNISTCALARKYGFVATEDDLLLNEELCEYSDIMIPAIMNNPRLIVYVSENCFLTDECINYVLKNYELTKEDLDAHPKLCNNIYIMQAYPQFKSYSTFTSYDDKIKLLVDCLMNKNIEALRNIPFLDSKLGSKVDIEDIIQLMNLLCIHFDETDEREQQRNYILLDKIIDGIINIRYYDRKVIFTWPDIVSLHDFITDNLISLNGHQKIKSLVDEISKFVKGTLSISYIYSKINLYYQLYKSTGELTLDDTEEFCNEVLNHHRNGFFHGQKSNITKFLQNQLELTDKKKKNILDGRKMKKISELIYKKRYDMLGSSEQQIKEKLMQVKNDLQNNKALRKKGIVLTDEKIVFLEIYFLCEDYQYINLQELLEVDDESYKFIINKYQKIKRTFIDYVNLNLPESEISDEEKLKIGFNYNNFIIKNKKRYYEVLANLILSLDNKTIKAILSNGIILKEVEPFIPFVDIFTEFNLKTLINILENYPKVKEKIESSYPDEDVSLHFDDIITLSNSYALVNNIHLAALGKDIIRFLGEENSVPYLDFYIKMLKRKESAIPPILIDDGFYKFTSGTYTDKERLLIGKRYVDSCIDLCNTAGYDTYEECLLKETGDVILVTHNNKYVGRILVIRRGNVVQLIPKWSDNFTFEQYSKIADEIIRKSQEVGDSIEYVFISNLINTSGENCIMVKDPRFVTEFPHADLSLQVVLLASKNPVFNATLISNLDFNKKMEPRYKKVRKNVIYDPTESDITSLRALNIYLQENEESKQQLIDYFEPFYMSNYEKVICGEDWYLAYTKDGLLEELILPIADATALEEINEVKKSIFADYLGTSLVKKI